MTDGESGASLVGRKRSSSAQLIASSVLGRSLDRDGRFAACCAATMLWRSTCIWGNGVSTDAVLVPAVPFG